MNNDFISAAGGKDAAYYAGNVPPFADFTLPPVVADFTNELLEARIAQKVKPQSAMLFGGAITDQRLGIAPKDYDLYICAPRLVHDVQALMSGGEGRGSVYEQVEEYLGYDFPIQLHEDSVSTGRARRMEGNCIAIQGAFHHAGTRRQFDLVVSDAPKTPLELSRQLPAPVMSAVVSLHPQGGQYAYHKDFEFHAARRILCTDEVRPGHFEKKAERKGLTFLRPAELPGFLAKPPKPSA